MKKTLTKKQFFTRSLVEWSRHFNKREMPWKNERDPYKIWISEIILQQTRVAQGEAYYHRFINAFPTITALANAPEERVYKLWEGLGYYNRCSSLIFSSKYLEKHYQGQFPRTYEQIRELKGVGDYTAAAIASFAFDLPYAVVDGNVSRVLARFFGIEEAVNSTGGKKIFSKLADQLLDKKDPAFYNQSIMDLGAVICKPKNPECHLCPLQTRCYAFKNDLQDTLPVKIPKADCRVRYFNYLVVRNSTQSFLRKRVSKDIWQNLYEPMVIESENLLGETELKKHPQFKSLFDKLPYRIISISKEYRQKLTHQIIHAQFIEIKVNKKWQQPGFIAVDSAEGTLRLAFPKIIDRYLKDKKVSLNLETK